MDVTEAAILVVTSSDDVHVTADQCRRMEPSGTRSALTGVDLYLPPPMSQQIEGPEIFQICNSLSCEDEEMRVDELWSVVGSLPGWIFSLRREYPCPMFCLPVKQADIVVSWFIWSSSPEKDELVPFGMKMQSGIRPYCRHFTCSCDFAPLHGGSIIGPKIISVLRV